MKLARPMLSACSLLLASILVTGAWWLLVRSGP